MFELFKGLTEKESQAIKLKYGFSGRAPMDGPEIAQVLGVANSRVNQLLNAAMRKIRQKMFQQKRYRELFETNCTWYEDWKKQEADRRRKIAEMDERW